MSTLRFADTKIYNKVVLNENLKIHNSGILISPVYCWYTPSTSLSPTQDTGPFLWLSGDTGHLFSFFLLCLFSNVTIGQEMPGLSEVCWGSASYWGKCRVFYLLYFWIIGVGWDICSGPSHSQWSRRPGCAIQTQCSLLPFNSAEPRYSPRWN